MEIYLVGGAVRDSLLGITVKEKDWVVVGATKENLTELGFKQVGSDFPVFLHPETKEEYSLARTERKSDIGHKGFSFDINPNVTLEEDLRRRDLTINAMAQSEDGSLIDPFNGQRDLKNKVLKQVSDAFQEDPLRVFRVARFASKLKYLGFSIDRKTMNTMNKLSLSGELETLPKERIWQETYKALQENNPAEYFRVLIECKATLGLQNIQKIDLDMFELITSKISNPKLRWASLASNLECDLNALNNTFGVPKTIQELSFIYRKLFEFTAKQGIDAENHEVLEFIEEVDALRRNKRFNNALEILEASKIPGLLKNKTLPWQEMSKKLKEIKPSSSELKSTEIIEDLRKQRLRVIEIELHNHE
tara:strand:- start:341 stop:1429 length:1089 start_codon:yes stop_codon:yes gene_type:complete